MVNQIFQKFFSIGYISVGPTICSLSSDGNWLGTAHIFSTNKDIFLEKKFSVVGIREYNNTITEELYNALLFLSIDKSDFDLFINELFILEWESTNTEKKPDIDRLKRRAYIKPKTFENLF